MGFKGFKFGEGAIREEQWDIMRDYVDQHHVYTILEIGAGYSTLLFSAHGVKVLSLETNITWAVEVMKKVNEFGNVLIYRYPYFPSGLTQFDMALVDGPAGLGDGRIASMRFAVNHAAAVFVHDAARTAEREAIDKIFEPGWDEKRFPGGLSLLVKQMSKEDLQVYPDEE